MFHSSDYVCDKMRAMSLVFRQLPLLLVALSLTSCYDDDGPVVAASAIPITSAFVTAERCFCAPLSPSPIASGELCGERVRDGVWNVSGYVTTDNGFQFDVGGRYTIR